MWERYRRGRRCVFWRAWWLAWLSLALLLPCSGQTNVPADAALDVRLERLMVDMEQTQRQMEVSRQQLEGMKQELLDVRQELARRQNRTAEAAEGPTRTSSIANAASPSTAAAEQEDIQKSQIATLDQIKVESASRYPVRVTGTVLLNGFVNTGRVDQAASPTTALGGDGSTGLSIRQTVLGFDASGPHLFGAASHADLRADFFGTSGASSGSSAFGLLRLRTAHAALDWTRTQLFFSLDRTILNPNAPESLVAVAQPELAWSGNLWSWNSQVGVSQTLGTGTRVRLQTALIDPVDPSTATPAVGTGGAPATQQVATLAEASRRPGAEARVAVLGRDDERSVQVGAGGYFSPHRVMTSAAGPARDFDAWAGTLDFRFPLPGRLVLSGSTYRGQGLGGLGGGGYKDFLFRGSDTSLEVRALDDVGGWAQLHQALGTQFTWNLGFGIDTAFAAQLRAYPGANASELYGSIARNRTAFANVIYSPSAYLRLSLEYRNLYTAPAPGPVWRSNITGVGAAYRF